MQYGSSVTLGYICGLTQKHSITEMVNIFSGGPVTDDEDPSMAVVRNFYYARLVDLKSAVRKLKQPDVSDHIEEAKIQIIQVIKLFRTIENNHPRIAEAMKHVPDERIICLAPEDKIMSFVDMNEITPERIAQLFSRDISDISSFIPEELRAKEIIDSIDKPTYERIVEHCREIAAEILFVLYLRLWPFVYKGENLFWPETPDNFNRIIACVEALGKKPDAPVMI